MSDNCKNGHCSLRADAMSSVVLLVEVVTKLLSVVLVNIPVSTPMASNY